MIVKSLNLRDFRNISELEFAPGPGVNVIFGENAQGKSNLLEAIWLFTGFRSFRGAKDRELIRFDQPEARLELSFYNDIRDMTASLQIGEKKKASLGGVSQENASRLAGEFLAIVFSPANLELVRGGPAERRRFLNQTLCQLKPNYAARLAQFQKVLQERNTLLKDLTYHSELYDTLEIWDERFASYSAYLMLERQQYLDTLHPALKEFYHGISDGKEEIELCYDTGFSYASSDGPSLKQEIMEQLVLHRKDDLITGHTTIGPHRDDLVIKLNDLPVRSFGSQGQQRSAALSMKMAEAAVIRDLTGKQPVALLDDVMSELDIHRQDYILNHIEGWQVFITCCEPSEILRSKCAVGNMFEMKEGNLCSSTLAS